MAVFYILFSLFYFLYSIFFSLYSIFFILFSLLYFLFHSLLPIAFIILKNHFAQTFESSIKRFSLIGFSKIIYKLLQIRVACYHKSRDWNVQFSGLSGLCVTFFYNIFVETVAVHIIRTVFFTDATWFSVGNHKNLFVGISLSSQNIHCQL